MKIQKIPLLLFIILLLTAMPMMTYAEEKPTFLLKSSYSNVKVGDEVIVTIEGYSLKNVFGYDLRLSYDTKVLKFHQASTAWEGFTVPQIVENGKITFAHTKLGDVKGENGNVQMASLRFEVIGQGDASIRLTRVKLVDSEGSSTALEPDLLLKVNILNNYLDTKGHWAEEYITRATKLGWITGYPNNTFAPDQLVNRAEFTTILSRALSLSSTSDLAHSFKDYEQIGEYAKAHVSRSIAAGLIKGYDDATFRPSQWITRSESTVMLMRALGYEDKMDSSHKLSYDDAEQVPNWAYSAVATATDFGLVNGRGNNKFAPGSYTTRAEAVTLILRIVDHIASTSKVN